MSQQDSDKPASSDKPIPQKGALFRILLRECVRVLALPWHLLLFLPRKARYRKKTRHLLVHQDPAHRDLANAQARRLFREKLSTRLDSIRHVYIACGEASGEELAIQLVQELRLDRPDLRISGMGGEALERAGVELTDNIVDHAVMGLSAVLHRLPFYLGVVGRFLQHLQAERVDLLIPVDNPGLNLVLCEAAKKRGIPVLYYICPQYWAWGPWRMARFRKAVDGAIAILPFEQELFVEARVPTGAAGHPLMDKLPPRAEEPREDVLILLPGSRRGELDRHLLPMLDLWVRFHERHPDAKGILPQNRKRGFDLVRERIADWERQGRTFPDLEIVDGDPIPLTASARACLVKSGTSCLQTALCHTPLVIVFQIQGLLEDLIARTQIIVPWIAAPNLVLGREAFPEHVGRDPRFWDEALDELDRIWEATPERQRQLQDQNELQARLEGPTPSQLATNWLFAPEL